MAEKTMEEAGAEQIKNSRMVSLAFECGLDITELKASAGSLMQATDKLLASMINLGAVSKSDLAVLGECFNQVTECYENVTFKLERLREVEK